MSGPAPSAGVSPRVVCHDEGSGADGPAACLRVGAVCREHPGRRLREHEEDRRAGRCVRRAARSGSSLAASATDPGARRPPIRRCLVPRRSRRGDRQAGAYDPSLTPTVTEPLGRVVIWDDGVPRRADRVEMTWTAPTDFRRTLESTDEVVIATTGSGMVVPRVLSPLVARLVIAKPLKVEANAHPMRIPTRSTHLNCLPALPRSSAPFCWSGRPQPAFPAFSQSFEPATRPLRS